jgi:transcriptional regulator with XRE-family HTH domain
MVSNESEVKRYTNIKTSKKNSNMSVAEVASKLGVSPGYIYKAENGNISVRLYRQLQFEQLYKTNYITFKRGTDNGRTTIYADRY